VAAIKDVGRIIICGGNGAGKSTLGAELAKKINVPFFDIEDFYFPDKTKEYSYDAPRSKKEVENMLKKELSSHSNFILAAVKPDFENELIAMYTKCVYINVSKQIRLNRVRNRSYQKFGEKMLSGGVYYEKEKEFFSMVENRAESKIVEWLDRLGIPIIEIDGTKDIDENIEFLTKELFV